MTSPQQVYEVRPRKDKRGVSLISDVLPFVATVACLLTMFSGSLSADDRSGTTSFVDNKEHWLFEFDVASNKPIGTKDEIIDIKAVIAIEARRTSRSAVVVGRDIRWISPSLVVAKATIARAEVTRLLCVCEKRQANWQILYVYRLQESPAGKL